MDEYIKVLQKCRLFAGIRENDLKAMLGCLGGRVVRFGKGETVLPTDSRAEYVGIVLSGAVAIVRDDFYGNRTIQARAEAGEMFGEAFACAGVECLPVGVEGVTPGRVLLIRLGRITQTCSNACEFHNRMVMNLLGAMALKNLQLNRKLEITSQRTTRDKLLSYLMSQARQARSTTFTIPFDRQGLADYLCVERSALSAEIGKLRREGILESERSSFRLLGVEGHI